MNLTFFNYDRVELSLREGQIDAIKNLKHFEFPDDFASEYKKPNVAKIYLVKGSSFYQYVGATFQPINKKLYQGLKADGKHGYHGYKWKRFDKAELIVWTFDGIDKSQMESIEAELVFQIRNKYGRWPESQNEIHFNNKFAFGRIIGQDIFNYVEKKYPLFGNRGYNKNSEIIFKEPLQYGLRGDPYLWKELKAEYEYSTINSLDDFKKMLLNCFKKVTNDLPMLGKTFYVEQYSFGGMSGGVISSDFWIEDGFPLLEERFVENQ